MKKSEQVCYEYDPTGKHIQHDYRKSNLVTLEDKKGLYDTYNCTRCGVTGQLRSFGGSIERDREYRAKRYAFCDTALYG